MRMDLPFIALKDLMVFVSTGTRVHVIEEDTGFSYPILNEDRENLPDCAVVGIRAPEKDCLLLIVKNA